MPGLAELTKIDRVHGLIRMRCLINFRVDPQVLQAQLPSPFRVREVRGLGMAGVCVIRLEHVGPRFMHASPVGVSSDNAAYRYAVEWIDQSTGEQRQGVFIPRRDTSSRLQQLLGGRMFPGEYHHSRFATETDGIEISVTVTSGDGSGDVRLEAREAARFPPDSVFSSLEEASSFFEEGTVGYSSRMGSDDLDGIRLATDVWRVSPLEVELASAAFLDRLPGAVLDNALVMRNTRHRWEAIGLFEP